METIDFRTLSIFVTTCRLMSLTQCAEELGLPKSTVSKAISKLEDQLQARLLERSTRKIEITDAGRVTLRRASLLVEEFKSLREDVRDIEQQVQGLLRISAPFAMGSYLAQYILPPFLQQWPKAQVSLELSNVFDDLFIQGMDLAIRVGQIADDRLVAKEVGYVTQVLVASPDYLRKHGIPESPEDIRQHNCITAGVAQESSFWTLVSKNTTKSIEVQGNFHCENPETAKKAATGGVGIAQIPVNSMICELEKQELIRILPDWHATYKPIYLVYRSGVNKPKRVSALLDYLLSIKEHFEFGPDHQLCQYQQCPLEPNQNRL
ncbi:LysR family transcriptional regulator [Microbulbifer sp. A4B17]|uniref:LysR family transcriptional regulator n=1 Tax=Microbulbifer sp. A4B17 TaxID=359370 RepID=UPI002105F31F|nr:LysR family transcriptional regulator [Microbulbifer sp. A4B17]